MRTNRFHTSLLLLAALLLSLHSLVPHVHGQPFAVSAKTEKATVIPPGNDWLGLLQDFFTDTDLGEDHLEHFSPGQDLDLEAITVLPPACAPVIVFAFRAEAVAQRKRPFFHSRHFPPACVYPDATSPRGPPARA